MSQLQLGALFTRVARRQQAVSFSRRFYQCVMALAVVYLLALAASRLLAWLPDWFNPQSLLLVPAAAALMAMIFTRRPSDRASARMIDLRMGTKDLFLTTAMLDASSANTENYKPLVLDAAYARAATIHPAAVVPFDPWNKLAGAAAVLLALTAASAWLPQFDPFGRQEQRNRDQQRQQRLAEMKQITAVRAEALRQKDLAGENSKEVAAVLEELKKDLGQMKPQDKAGNLRDLRRQQQDLGQMWKQMSDRQLREAMNPTTTAQRFGAMETAKSRQWKEQLAAGNTAGLKQEIAELQQLAQELSQTSDPQKKQELQKQLEQRTRELTDFANKQAPNPAMGEALARALQQLDMASMQGLSEEALKAMQESLELSDMELDQMAQSMRDMESLQKALETLRLAQSANESQPLDGGQMSQMQALEEYRQYFLEQIKGQMCQACQAGEGQCQGGMCPGGGMGLGMGAGQGSGGGMGGQGQGRGNIAPEDPTSQTDFKNEKVNTAVQAGRMLMEWKTKEVSESGDMQRDYQQSLRQVKQSVNEAILREEVPPGYHEAIKKYFDTIDQSVVKPTEP